MLNPLCVLVSGILVALSVQAQALPQAPDLMARLSVPVRYASVFGQRIAYYEAGPQSAPVVILIPNLGWDSNAWAQNLPAVSRSYHVLSIDPLGIGQSDKPLIEYKMNTWTDCFSELMRIKKIKRATFVGAVMGGALAVQMALDHPEQVEAIVVAASNSGPGPHVGASTGGPFGPSLSGTRASLLESFYDASLITESLVRSRLTYRLGSGDGYTIQRHLADHRAPYSVEELKGVAVPALFIWCREDRITPLSWGQDYAAAVPGAKLAVIEHCGHFPNLEQPAAFNQNLLEFLASVKQPTKQTARP